MYLPIPNISCGFIHVRSPELTTPICIPLLHISHLVLAPPTSRAFCINFLCGFHRSCIHLTVDTAILLPFNGSNHHSLLLLFSFFWQPSTLKFHNTFYCRVIVRPVAGEFLGFNDGLFQHPGEPCEANNALLHQPRHFSALWLLATNSINATDFLLRWV